MNKISCDQVIGEYRSEIEEIQRVQKQEHREAIFFIYEDGSTSKVFKGDHTSISLSKDQEKMIMNNGNVRASVHSHPSGFDPSTIDIMTGLMTQQEFMCISTPAMTPDGEDDFVLTCIELGELDTIQSQRLLRAMRRSTVGVTDFGRMLRKETNLTRFDVQKCRSQNVNGRRSQAMAESGKSMINRFNEF